MRRSSMRKEEIELTLQIGEILNRIRSLHLVLGIPRVDEELMEVLILQTTSPMILSQSQLEISLGSSAMTRGTLLHSILIIE